MATNGDRLGRVSVVRGKHRGRRVWIVGWTEDGKRRRQYFGHQDAADAAAEDLRLSRGEDAEEWRRMSPAEKADVLAAVRLAKQHGTTVAQTVRDWIAGIRGSAPDCPTLDTAIAALLATKETAARSPRYTAALRHVLEAFAAGRGSVPLSAITSTTITEWLATKPEAARPTYLSRLSTLFGWAIRHEYVGRNPCDRVELPKARRGTPSALSVRQSAKVLAWARRRAPRALPAVVLSLMAGLRPEEAQQTTWDAVDLKAGLIRVDAQTSKVRQRRVVYPMPAAIAWLQWAKDHGGVLPLPRITWRRTIRALRDRLKLDRWPQDVTRHTAATYWLAATGDPYAVAESLGHSPAILKTHYRALVTRADAERFWRLFPNRPERRAAAGAPPDRRALPDIQQPTVSAEAR